MFVWIVAGYCLAAVIFYSYIVATAEVDPYDNATLAVKADEQRQVVMEQRKAA
jgi:hypothetical protein